MQRSHCLLIICSLLCSLSWGASGYATARLKAMASRLPLSGIDTLSTGEYIHFFYKNHPLTVRINTWNEVEHIGLRLFTQETKVQKSLPIYDFLERYLLELNMTKEMEDRVRLLHDVSFETGKPEEAMLLKGTEIFNITCQAFRDYRVEWIRNDTTLLAIRFDMDYQLLSGCNLIELEERYRVMLQRFQTEDRFREQSASTAPIVKESTNYHIQKGGFFISEAIRNDLYYQKDEEGWKLITGIKKPYQSIANSLLSAETEGDYDLALTCDLYGYKVKKDTIKLSNWQSLCKYEGCISYFGMKKKTDSAYTGTIFAVNETCGYMHMLSVTFPMASLTAQKGLIEGRLFVYIPLHNVSDKLFYHADFKKINDENE